MRTPKSNRLTVVWLSMLVVLTGVSPASEVQEAPVIRFDINDTKQIVQGFGAQIWSGDPQARAVLETLGMRYVRMTVGPNWPNVDAKPPTGATRDVMDRFLATHFDGDHEPRLQNARDSWAMADQLGIQVVMIQFPAPENWLTTDGQRLLLPEHLDDFARYWGALVHFMAEHGMRAPYIELSNEPDGDWNTYIPPEAYNTLVILTRKELDERGYEDVKIVGPGLAWLDHDNGGQRWVDALTDEGVDAIHAWSTHTWDEKFVIDAPPPFMVERWHDFKAAIRRKDPAGDKPIFITEYASGATTFHDRVYDAVESAGGNRASDSHAYAQRVFEQTLQHVNQGASVLIAWEAADQPWSGHAWGLIRGAQNGHRPRPVFNALKTLLPEVPKDAHALRPDTYNPHVTSAGFLGNDQLVIALANGTNTPQTRTLVIDHARGLRLIDVTRFHEGVVSKIESATENNRLSIELPPISTLTCRFKIDPAPTH